MGSKGRDFELLHRTTDQAGRPEILASGCVFVTAATAPALLLTSWLIARAVPADLWGRPVVDIAMVPIGVVASAATAVTALAAWRGVGLWRDQLVGSSSHDMARRLLVEAERLHSAATRSRMALESVGEWPIRDYSWQLERIEPFGTAAANWSAAAVEARVLWGSRDRAARRLVLLSAHVSLLEISFGIVDSELRRFHKAGAREKEAPPAELVKKMASEVEFIVKTAADWSRGVEALEVVLRPRLIR